MKLCYPIKILKKKSTLFEVKYIKRSSESLCLKFVVLSTFLKNTRNMFWLFHSF